MAHDESPKAVGFFIRDAGDAGEDEEKEHVGPSRGSKGGVFFSFSLNVLLLCQSPMASGVGLGDDEGL